MVEVSWQNLAVILLLLLGKTVLAQEKYMVEKYMVSYIYIYIYIFISFCLLTATIIESGELGDITFPLLEFTITEYFLFASHLHPLLLLPY